MDRRIGAGAHRVNGTGDGFGEYHGFGGYLCDCL